MGAQYFTAVSSQRALRHVGISEADYAMQFIYLKNRPFRSQTHSSRHTGGKLNTHDCNVRACMSVKCLARDATKKTPHPTLANHNVITKMSSWCLQKGICAFK